VAFGAAFATFGDTHVALSFLSGFAEAESGGLSPAVRWKSASGCPVAQARSEYGDYLRDVTKSDPPIQSAMPKPGLTPLELAQDLVARIEQGNAYARSRKNRFRSSSSVVRMMSLILTVTSTIILGLQELNVWTGIAFSLVAVVTSVNTLEPFFAWRSRWVLMEEAQYKFYRLRDDLTYYIAASQPDQLDESRIQKMFDEYQQIWDQLSNRWMEYRRTPGA
jgi:hypothetical protein